MYKILVADDEKDVVSLLKDYFEINKYLVLWFTHKIVVIAAVI